jgi:hypothetical protein
VAYDDGEGAKTPPADDTLWMDPPCRVHEFYFKPQYDKFKARTLWSLSNALTSAFKELEPIPQFKVTEKLSGFLEQRYLRKF